MTQALASLEAWAAARQAALAFDLFSPLSRISLLHVAAGAAFALIAFRLERGGGIGGFLRFLAPASVWRHPSVRTDLKIYLFNLLVRPARLIVFGLTAAAAAAWIGGWLAQVFGPARPPLEGPAATALLAVLLILAYDFASYVNHRLSHEVPLLWAFHRVHHSAEVLTPLTLVRKHPVYDAFAVVMDVLLVAPLQGLIVWRFGGEASLAALALVNVGFGVFGMMAGALRHSHVWLSFGPVLGRLVVSPAMHQIHHSSAERHWDRNYGEVFAVWDILLRTAYLPREREALTFGLPEAQPHPTLARALAEPFAFAARLLRPARPMEPAE